MQTWKSMWRGWMKSWKAYAARIDMQNSYLSLSSYRQAMEAAIGQGDFANVLADIALRAEAVKNEPRALGRIYGSPTLDGLCTLLGREYARRLGIAPTGFQDPVPTSIYVCTETYGTGGHARVIADLIRADSRRLHHVVFTNLWERERLFADEFNRLGARVSVLPPSPPLDKLRNLMELLAREPSARVYLFNHHQDSIAVAGVAGGPQVERYFIHHCDYQFCLGTFLPDTRHVDLHTMGFHRCRRWLGLADNLHWPLTCSDVGASHSGQFMANGTMTTCCCGSENKFTGQYPIDYFDAVAARLRAVPGKHIHIGPISNDRQQRLAAKLQGLGIALDRFVYLPSVPDLRQALVDHRVDAYLVSFPMGGGRALIEALAAGVPVIGHVHHRDKLLSGTDLLPEAAPVWTDLPELLAILTSLTKDRLQQLSSACRNRYEAHHHPRLLADCVQTGAHLEPPPERVPDVEPIQALLFEKAFMNPQPQASRPWGGTTGKLRLPV
jgi:hypothetical protein